MKITRMGLMKTLKEGDYDGLVEVMGHLMKVKERQVVTDNMFVPLKETIELLKTYGEEMPEEIHVKLQVDGSRPRSAQGRELWGHGQRSGCCSWGQGLQARPPPLGAGVPVEWGGGGRLLGEEGTVRWWDQ